MSISKLALFKQFNSRIQTWIVGVKVWPLYCFFFFKKIGPTPASFSFIFGLFKQTLLQFLQQINVKKCHVHPVYSTGIRTHDLWSWASSQGSRHYIVWTRFFSYDLKNNAFFSLFKLDHRIRTTRLRRSLNNISFNYPPT